MIAKYRAPLTVGKELTASFGIGILQILNIASMHLIRNLVFSLACLFSGFQVYAQCYGNAQAESTTCSGTPRTLTAFSTCGNCTHSWSPAPAAGQNTPMATYVYNMTPGFGTQTMNVTVNSYNPNVPCNYYDLWQVGVGAQPNIGLPALANGPWNGDTAKVWIYARTYLDVLNSTFGRADFVPTWSVTGGVKLRSVNHQTNIYTYDSVFVKWNGVGNMALTEAQLTMHYPQYMMSTMTCNWTPSPFRPAYPQLQVFNHPFCPGVAATFYTFPFAGSSYTWSVTNGTVASGQGTNSVQIIMNGAGTVSVARDSSGTITNTSASVTPVPSVINLGPDQTICQYANTTLTANPGFAQYNWSTGATTQSIVVSNPGTYSVTGTNFGGCAASDTVVIAQTVTVRPNLGPDIHTCAFPVTLDAGPGYVSYTWSNGASTQSINVVSAGNYRVDVVDVNGCGSSDTITVFDSHVTVNLPTSFNYCVPGSTTLNSASSNVTNYLWSTGATTPSIQLSTLGSQSIWLQGSNSFGCTGSDTVIVTGNARPTPNLGADQSVCPGASATFNAGSGYSSYLWNTGQATQSITPNVAGTYRVTVTNAQGCTGSDTVQLLNFPFTPPNLGPDINVCQGSATLDAGSGYAVYLWNIGANTQSIFVSNAGTYSVTVTSANGCTGSDAINVSNNNVVMSLGPDVTVCEPQTVVLDPQLNGVFTYAWSTGASTPTVTLSTPGSYNVNLSAANAFGCTALDTIQVTILPTPAIHLGADTVLCADTSIVLDAGNAFVSYLWSTASTGHSVTINSGGSYRVVATAANGCQRSDTIMISGLIDCVFPGDVNYDHVVDLSDVLALGTVLGMTGPTRQAPSLQWYGQQASNWNWSVVSGVDTKQADVDGNGLLQLQDTLGIQQNFANTHSKMGSVTSGNGQIRIAPLTPQVTAGGIARFAVYYEGVGSTALDSVHGLALQLAWPSTGLAPGGLISIDYSQAWFAPNGGRLDFTRTSANGAALAISRTLATDTAGQGMLMILSFQTDSNMASGNSVSFAPTVVTAEGVGMNLLPQTPQSTVIPVTIAGAALGRDEIISHIRIWPVPADDEIRVLIEGISNVHRIQLIDLLGQIVADIPVTGQTEYAIPVSDFPNGNYFLRLQTEQGPMVRKMVVAHGN